jgi:hypothetical protein
MTEEEMMQDLAAADAAGDDQLAQHIAGRIKAARQPQPGLASRALRFLGTPFSESINGHPDPLLEKQKQLAVERGPGLVGKDSGNVMAGAGTFVSGMPGYDRNTENPETTQRLGQFRHEHPIAATALSLGGGFANPVLPGAIGASGGPSGAESLANSLAARTLRGTANEYKTLGKEGAQEMGDFLLRNKAVRFGSSPTAVAERVSALPQSTGQALGESIKALDATGGQVSKQAIAQQFGQLAEQAKAGGPGAAPLVAKFEKAAADIMQDIQTSGQPMMSFKQAEQWKQAYQAPINYAKQTNSPLEMGSKEIASAARQAVEDAAGAASTEASPVGEAFLQAKKESGLAQQAAKMAHGAEGRRTARNMVSPAGVGASLLSASTAIASGHPWAAIPSLAAGPVLQILRERGPASAAVLLKSMAPGINRSVAQGGANDIRALMEMIRQKRSMLPELASNDQ